MSNKVISGNNILSVFDCVDENLPEVESNGSDNDICDSQECVNENGISGSEQLYVDGMI